MSGKIQDKNSTQFIRSWEDIEAKYCFRILPTDTMLKDEDVETLIRKIILFHKEYVILSRKYNIGEILTEEYLKIKGLALEDYLSGLESDLFFNTIRFFPRSIASFDENTILASKFFYHNEKSEIVNNYIYGIDAKGQRPPLLCDIDYLLKHKELPKKGVSIDTNSYLSYELGEFFINPIGFDIKVLSNILFPYLEGDNHSDEIDNRVIAYLNAPRFNSCLRDLKKIFFNYGWSFKFEHDERTLETIKYLTEDGVLIDGKIIYQEDINEGRVTIPGVKNYPA